MNLILPLLLLALAFITYRLYTVKNAVSKKGGLQNLKINLPVRFYVEQTILIFCICLFLYALNPVEAFYAICAVLGTFIDTILSVLYYSAKYEADIETQVKPETV